MKRVMQDLVVTLGIVLLYLLVGECMPINNMMFVFGVGYMFMERGDNGK